MGERRFRAIATTLGQRRAGITLIFQFGELLEDERVGLISELGDKREVIQPKMDLGLCQKSKALPGGINSSQNR